MLIYKLMCFINKRKRPLIHFMSSHDDDIEDSIIYSNLQADVLYKKYCAIHQRSQIKSQTIAHQTCLLRYFSDPTTILPDRAAVYNMIGSIEQLPSRIHGRISPTISQLFIQWMNDFLRKPHELALALKNFHMEPNPELDMFAFVTFPALYGHFFNNDSLTPVVVFLKELFSNTPSYIYGQFFTSFMYSAHNFLNVIWETFDNEVIKHSPVNTTSDYFVHMLTALEIASTGFSAQHLEIIDYFFEFNPDDFANYFVNEFLIKSFLSTHIHYQWNPISHPLIKYLHFLSQNPKSAHFKKMLSKIHSKIGTMFCTEMSSRNIVVISIHECFLIENLVTSYPDLSEVKSIASLSVPKKFFTNFEPVYIELQTKPQLKKFQNCFFPKNEEKIEFVDLPAYARSWRLLNFLKIKYGISPVKALTEKINDPYLDPFITSIPLLNDKQFHEYAWAHIRKETNNRKNEIENVLLMLACLGYENQIHNMLILQSNHNLQIFLSRLMNSPNCFYTFDSICYSKFISKVSLSYSYRRYSKNQDKSTRPSFVNLEIKHSNTPRKRRNSEGRLDNRLNSKFYIDQFFHYCTSPIARYNFYIKKMDEIEVEDKIILTLSELYTYSIDVYRMQHMKVGDEYGSKMNIVKYISKKMDNILQMRKGSIFIYVSQIGSDVMQLCDALHISKEDYECCTKVLKNVLIHTTNYGIFYGLSWASKFIEQYPLIKDILYKSVFKSLRFLTNLFYLFLNEVDPDLFKNSSHYFSSLFMT